MSLESSSRSFPSNCGAFSVMTHNDTPNLEIHCMEAKETSFVVVFTRGIVSAHLTFLSMLVRKYLKKGAADITYERGRKWSDYIDKNSFKSLRRNVHRENR